MRVIIESYIYTNAYAASLSEFAAYILSGLIYAKVGRTRSFVAFTVISATSCFIMVSIGGVSEKEWVFPLLILLMKFGQSALYNIMYIVNAELFPTLFAATGLGYCCFFGRLSCTLAPLIVEANFNAALWIFAISSTISLSFFWCL